MALELRAWPGLSLYAVGSGSGLRKLTKMSFPRMEDKWSKEVKLSGCGKQGVLGFQLRQELYWLSISSSPPRPHGVFHSSLPCSVLREAKPFGWHLQRVSLQTKFSLQMPDLNFRFYKICNRKNRLIYTSCPKTIEKFSYD